MRAVRAIPAPQGGRIELWDAPEPTPGPGQVKVRVRASGLNRGEITQAKALMSGEPVAVGVEFAGEIAALGADVTGWKVGDRVMGHGRGAQAQYTLAAARALMPVPDGMPWVEAASFPNVFITAHDALISNGQLVAGESVLVNAASSGIGLAAIQIAALFGAKPIFASSRSAAKAERLRSVGVDVAINTSRQSQVDEIMNATEKRGVDVIIDSVGGTVFEDNLKSLAVKGRLVHIARLGSNVAQIDLTQLWLKRLKLIGVTFRTRTEEERLACIEACARDLLEPLKAGRLKWPIDKVFPLEAIHDAHAYMLRDEHFGKIVLSVD